MEKKILARKTEPKKRGGNISVEKYTPVRDAIVKALTDQPELTYQELLAVVESQLVGNFEGSINWYTANVKADLETKKIIERLPNTKPHKVRLIK